MSDSKVTKFFKAVFLTMQLALICASCGGPQSETAEDTDPRKPSLKPLVGVDFYEVKRSFDNGISWDSMGFVQVPEWHMRFEKEDSVLVYSPPQDKMLGYKVYHDHDAYFHFARGSWRMIEINQDSVLMQRLNLTGLKVDKIRSNIYMKFYSKDYLDKKFPGQSLEELRKPKRADSVFVRAMVERANRNPANLDSVFASRQYARLTSNSPALTLKKRKIENIDLSEKTPSYEYLYPEYYITLDNAYRNFNHDFSVIIDQYGKMHLGKVYVLDEFLEQRTKVVHGIIDVYLQNLLDIEPAQTLGLKHSSMAYFYMRGKQAEGVAEKNAQENPR